MSLRQIGPVSLDETAWGNPQASWTGQPDMNGIRGASITGVVDWTRAQQLSELIGNPDLSVTIGAHSGVLDYLLFDDDLLRPFTGFYLLQGFDITGEQQWSLAGVDGPVPFTLSGAHLGDDRELVIVRTGRAKANDFGLTAVTLAAEPFYTESALNDAQAPSSSDVAGIYATGERVASRLYDRRGWAWTPESATSAKLLYLRDLGAAQDRTTIVTAPRLNDDPVPSWVRYRGGDVRAYDRSDDREVYGPSHPFALTSDLGVTNGILRFWVGARGLPPYLHVSAWRTGAWREMGAVNLGAPSLPGNVLLGARLTKCTPDIATVALLVDGLGDVFVTLRRGERMLRIAHGPGRPPLVAGTRRVEWKGTPPGSLTNVVTAAARFGNGLALSAGGSIVFNWPPTVPVERWSVAGRTKMDAASTAKGDQRLATILAGGTEVGSLGFRASDDKLVLALGAQTVESAALTFSSGQSVGWIMRFDTTDGLALTWNVADGAVGHVANAAHVNPSSTGAAYQFLGLLGPGTVGGGGGSSGVLVNDTSALVNDTVALVNNS